METQKQNIQSSPQLIKQIPSAVDIEEAVIGASISVGRDAVSRINWLESKEFYDTKNQYIWSAIKSLYDRNAPVDMLLVAKELNAISALEYVGGEYTIADLSNRYTDDYNIEYHASIIEEMYRKRYLITEITRYGEMLYSPTSASKDIAKRVQEDLARLIRTQSVGSVYIVDPEHPSPSTEFLLEINGTQCFPRRDITAFKAKAKNGKTQLGSISVAAMIAKTEASAEDSIQRPIPVCGVRRVRTEPLKVLLVDTEQSFASSDKLTRRILAMAGYEWNKRCEYLTVCNLRLHKKGDRLEYIVQEVEKGGYDMVLIDGIKDLANDFNDNKESDMILEETLMPMIQKTGVNMACVLHENPSKDTDKMRGHLGTELCNKAFEVFQVAIDKDAGVFNVETSERRETDVDAWAFRFTDEGTLEETTPTCKTRGSHGQGQNAPTREERNWAQFVKAWEKNLDLSMTKEEIITEHLRLGTIKEGTCKNRIKEYLASKRIIADGQPDEKGTRFGLAAVEKSALRGYSPVPASSTVWQSADNAKMTDDSLPFEGQKCDF